MNKATYDTMEAFVKASYEIRGLRDYFAGEIYKNENPDSSQDLGPKKKMRELGFVV